jgi:hypothetical protein
MLNLTLFASNGSPLWNVTPVWSRSSIVVGSGVVHESASIGWIEPS